MSSIPIGEEPAIGALQPRSAGWLIGSFCAYLLFIGAAELLIVLVDPVLGLVAHALLLLALTLHAGLGHDAGGRKLALALVLAPLMRILSLALPFVSLLQLAWYPVVSALLLVSALLTIRQLRMSRSELGLRPGNLLIQLMLMGGGLGIGAAEYALLGAPQQGVASAWNALQLLVVLLLVFAGVVEELIFRGLIQSLALSAMGRWALVYVALLFAALHIGYLSAPMVAFAFGVGLIFACAAYWSGSIVGVALAHGLANITLFILMPFFGAASGQYAAAIRSAIVAGSILAAVAMVVLIGRTIWQRRVAQAAASVTSSVPYTNPAADRAPAAPIIPSNAGGLGATIAVPQLSQKLLFNALLARLAPHISPTADRTAAAPIIRALRRSAGMTYVELAQRTQLPARLLAEIEHGLRLPNHDQLARIFQALGVDMQQLTAANVAFVPGTCCKTPRLL